MGDRADVLEVSELCWHLGTRRIVDGVNLVVRPAEIVGLLGPNGAGKTVTLSMIVGLLRPSAGRILIDGTDVTKLPFTARGARPCAGPAR
jgi:ABC-type lipopolysaccharide export system ATPase subunit